MLKHNQVLELAEADIAAISKEDLVYVSGFTFDHRIPKEKRPAFILEKIKNPYIFCVGDMSVKLEFLDNAPLLQDCFWDCHHSVGQFC